MRKFGVIVAVIIAVAIGASIAFKLPQRLALQRAKNVAMKGFTPDDSRGAFDLVPALLKLDSPAPVPAMDTAEFNKYKVWFIKPDVRQDDEKWVDLQYAKFAVRILPPADFSDLTDVAHQLGMKDRFELLSAAHHATRKGIETQPDIASVKRNVVLIGVKSMVMAVGSGTYYAAFEAENLRGFIAGDIGKGKELVIVEAFSSTSDEGWSLTFRNTNGASMDEVKRFLSAMRVEQIVEGATSAAREN